MGLGCLVRAAQAVAAGAGLLGCLPRWSWGLVDTQGIGQNFCSCYLLDRHSGSSLLVHFLNAHSIQGWAGPALEGGRVDTLDGPFPALSQDAPTESWIVGGRASATAQEQTACPCPAALGKTRHSRWPPAWMGTSHPRVRFRSGWGVILPRSYTDGSVIVTQNKGLAPQAWVGQAGSAHRTAET